MKKNQSFFDEIAKISKSKYPNEKYTGFRRAAGTSPNYASNQVRYLKNKYNVPKITAASLMVMK